MNLPRQFQLQREGHPQTFMRHGGQPLQRPDKIEPGPNTRNNFDPVQELLGSPDDEEHQANLRRYMNISPTLGQMGINTVNTEQNVQ